MSAFDRNSEQPQSSGGGSSANPFGGSGGSGFGGSGFGGSGFGDSGYGGTANSNSGQHSGFGPSSYVLSEVQNEKEWKHTSYRRVSFTDAPIILWVSAVAYLAGAGQIGWAFIKEVSSDSPSTLLLVPQLAVLIVVGAGIWGILKAQVWGRILLSALTVLGMFLIVVGNLWVTTLLFIAGMVLLWLPRNSRWFGFRKRLD